MESKLKAAAQDSVGEIPTYENLLLREDGFPHLVDRTQWQPAGTTPDHPCLCETRHNVDTGMGDDYRIYQYWNGRHFGLNSHIKKDAMEGDFIEDDYQHVQWREVQS